MKDQLKELHILHFLNDGARTTIIVLLPLIATDLSLSLTQVGFLGSSQSVLGAVLALPTGYLLGKFGGYKLILALLLIYSLGILFASFALNAPMLILAYIIASVGFGMFHPAGFALTAKISHDNNVGRNIGNFQAIGEIGRVALPPVAIFAAAIIGWRITLSIVAVIGLVLLIIARFYFPQKDVYSFTSDNKTSETQKDFLKHTFSLLRNKKAVLVTTAAIFDSIASSPIYVFLPFLFVSKGFNTFELSIAMGIFFIGTLFGKTFLGRLSDKFGQKIVFLFSEFTMAISLLLIVFTNVYIMLLFFAALLGSVTKGTSPIVLSMFSQLADKDHYHKIFAVSELFITVAAAVSIIALGAWADSAGISIVFFTGTIFGILALIPIITLMRLKP